MRVYRGPSSKEFNDDSHEKVDDQDLTCFDRKWTGTLRFRVNVTKDISERQAVAHVELNDSEILSLHKGLVDGLYEKSKK